MKQTVFIFFVLLFAGCAKQTQPTGGPKDETPPELIASNPSAKTVNFKGDKVELTFSELIQLNKPKEQIIISPSVKETETTYRNNKLILTFKTKLQDSTTYSINFREAVQDLTEKNPATNLKIAFSTGAFLDSMSISGVALDVLTNKAMNDVTVAVHYKNDTFNIFKHKAEIITKTDVDGNFSIENLKSTEYFLYAFVDKNKNLFVDSKSEKYAFLSKTISLKEPVKNVVLPLFSLDARTLRMISSRPYQNYFNIKTNKSFESYTIKYSTNEPSTSTIAEDLSSIKLYQTFDVPDSTQASLFLRDSVGNQIDTAFYVKFNQPNKEFRLDKFNTNIDKPIVFLKDQELTTKIYSNKPIKTILYDSIYFAIDSLTRYTFISEEVKLDTQKLTLTLTKKFPVGTFVTKEDREESLINKKIKTPQDSSQLDTQTLKIIKELILGKAALISIDNDSSTVFNAKPSYYKEEDLGVIIAETSTSSAYYFIDVLNSNGQVAQRGSNKNSLSFKDLIPGDYSLRLTIDTNGNGKWDVGNYLLKMEPEPIYFYYGDNGEQKFSLKANWELGPLLIKEEYPVNKLGTKKNELGKKK
jgi:uncharacterized protein (DUF2141 family)